MRKILSKIDIPLLIVAVMLISFGLVMIYSSSSITAVVRYGFQPYHFFVRQAAAIMLAVGVGTFCITFPTKHYKKVMPFLLFGLILALVYLLSRSESDSINNAQSWIKLGFFSLQPSEFAKTFLIIYFASYYNDLSNKSNYRIGKLFQPLVYALFIIALVVVQPDLGSAVIISAICFMMFISVPEVRKNKSIVIKVLGVALAVAVILTMFFGNKIINKMQSSRFNFTNPCSRYTESTGYQVCNGFIAINNGGLFGVGLGNSTQKYLYLPESHTDFIFPIIIEETGLIAGILVIALYAYLLSRILKIAKKSENLRCSLLAYGTFWYLTFHILVNLMGVLALIPLTGVPLPFLSYGGSFILNAVVMLFIVERANFENNINKTNREIKSL